MKIIYILPTTKIGGGPLQAYSLANNLVNKVDFVLIAPNDGPFFEKFQKLECQVYDLPIRSIKPSLVPKIIGIVKDNQPQIIHAHGKGAGIYARIVGLFTQVPVIYTMHGIHYRDYNWFVKWFYLFMEKMLSYITAKIINVGISEQFEAIRLGITNKKQSIVINNSVEIDANIVKPEATIQEFNLQYKILISCVGRLTPQKGQEYLIKALPKIIEKFPNVLLLIVGDGELQKEYKQLVQPLHLKNNIIFTGGRSDSLSIMKASRLLILPSLWEGLPLTLIEAGMLSVPIIATDVTGNHDIVHHGYNGMLVPPKDIDALSRTIIYLLSNPKVAKKYATTMENTVNNHFGFNRMVNQTYKLYQDVLS